MAFSRDGKSVLALSVQDRSRLRLIPIGEGKPVDLPPTGLEYQWARYFPDGRLLALANEVGRPLRLYVIDREGRAFAITPPTTVRNAAISPDGAQVALLAADGKLKIYPAAEGGSGRVIPTTDTLAPMLWTDDDSLYVQHLGAYTQIPTRLSRLHLPTGRLTEWQQIAPTDVMGVNAITKVVVSRDTHTVIFNYRRVLSELFVAAPASR